MEDTQAPNDSEDIEIDIGPLHGAPISTQMVDVTFVPAPRPTQDAEVGPKSPAGPIVVDPHFMPRDAKGHFLPGYKATSAIATSQQASAMNQRRNEVAASKARASLALAYEQHTGKPGRPTDAYAEIAGEFARSALANAMDKPREGVEAGKFALRLARMLPEADKQQNIGVAVQIVLAPEAASFVEGIWTEEE